MDNNGRQRADSVNAVDLTEDEVIDITSPDNSVIILSETPANTRSRQASQQGDNDIQVLHHKLLGIPVTSDRPRLWNKEAEEKGSGTQSHRDSQSANAANTAPATSPDISCSICLDSYSQIIAQGDTMMSTVCGHVFCQKCIKAVIAAKQPCPKCRRKLTTKAVHPVFF